MWSRGSWGRRKMCERRISCWEMGSETEAKSICVHKLEDLLLLPMFTIFHVQHEQIASKTETKNSLIFHLKSSMAKVRHWNSTTVRDFCSNLMTRFPLLNETFLILFSELQELTCKILNQSSESTTYVPIREEVHTYLHSFISACSDAFISHTHWFAVEESSTEYQSCKNNAKVRMQQANVVENTVMNFVKAGPKVLPDESPSVGSVSDLEQQGKEVGDDFEDDDSFTDEDDLKSVDDFASDDSRALASKNIDLVSGVVREGDPQFSTPFAAKKNDNKKVNREAGDDSECDISKSDNSDSGYDTWYTTSDWDSSDSESSTDSSTGSSSDSSGSSGSSASSWSDSSSSSSSSESSSSSSGSSSSDSVSSFDTDFDCESSSSGTDTDTSDESASEGSSESISVGDVNSVDSSDEEDLPIDMLAHILRLKRKEKRHRSKRRRK